MSKPKLETLLVHAGEPRIGGSITMPIFQSSTYETKERAGYHDIRYGRLSNTPSHDALHQKLAAIEGAEAALATSSGMSAISTVLLSLLRAGDHLIAQDSLYGGTHDLFAHDFPALGIEVTRVSGDDAGSWEKARRPGTKAFYCESITNPLVRVADLEGIVAFARKHALVSVIDNTFATPLGFRPIERGFDLAVHSATKYLNGHSDLIAGAAMGSRALIERVKHKLDHLGGSLDAHACFLLQRGLKTLAVRFRQQSQTAMELARFLERHAAVSRVHHPSLESHPDYARARKLLALPGAMMSFELRDAARVPRLFERMTLPIKAPSLGGCETLITQPAETSHAGLSASERQRVGISDGLLRVSVGLEAAEDLVADFAQALE
jgi:cystathionine beta-lyase/cystathionine gamma-synthase